MSSDAIPLFNAISVYGHPDDLSHISLVLDSVVTKMLCLFYLNIHYGAQHLVTTTFVQTKLLLNRFLICLLKLLLLMV